MPGIVEDKPTCVNCGKPVARFKKCANCGRRAWRWHRIRFWPGK